MTLINKLQYSDNHKFKCWDLVTWHCHDKYKAYLASSIAGSWHLPFLYRFWYKLPQGKIEWQSRVSFQLQSNLRCMTSHIWMLFWIAVLHLLAISLQRHPMDSLEDCLLGHGMEDRREHLFQFFHARSIHTRAKVPWPHHSKDLK